MNPAVTVARFRSPSSSAGSSTRLLNKLIRLQTGRTIRPAESGPPSASQPHRRRRRLLLLPSSTRRPIRPAPTAAARIIRRRWLANARRAEEERFLSSASRKVRLYVKDADRSVCARFLHRSSTHFRGDILRYFGMTNCLSLPL